MKRILYAITHYMAKEVLIMYNKKIYFNTNNILAKNK